MRWQIMREIATRSLRLSVFFLLLFPLPLLFPSSLRLLSFFLLLLSSPLKLDPRTLLADTRVAQRPVVRTLPLFAALCVDLGGRFPFRRVISIPWVAIVVHHPGITRPVLCQLVIRIAVEGFLHRVCYGTLRPIVVVVLILLVGVNGTLWVRNVARRRIGSAWTARDDAS